MADRLTLNSTRLLILVPAIVGLIVGASAVVVVARRPVIYESRALVLVDQPGSAAASADFQVIDKLVRLRAKYAGLVITDRIAAPVAVELGIPVAAVRGRLFARPIENTTLVAILGRDRDAARARALAQAAAEQLAEDTADDQAQFSVPEPNRVILSIVTEAQRPIRQGATSTRLIGVAAVSGGLAAVLVRIALVAGRRSR